jgi:hypothetical protein
LAWWLRRLSASAPRRSVIALMNSLPKIGLHRNRPRTSAGGRA